VGARVSVVYLAVARALVIAARKLVRFEDLGAVLVRLRPARARNRRF
jgi:hypothetical protein